MSKIKTVKITKDPKTGDTYLDLKQVLKGTNVKIEDVAFYELNDICNGQIVLVLYDKNKKKLKVEYK